MLATMPQSRYTVCVAFRSIGNVAQLPSRSVIKARGETKPIIALESETCSEALKYCLITKVDVKECCCPLEDSYWWHLPGCL